MALSNKHQAFVAEYLKDFNGSQAAIRAGYSERSSRSTASELLTNPNIQEEIQAQIAERAMGSSEVLQRLAEHGRGDMGDFLDITSMGFVIDLHKAKEKGLTHLIKKVKMRTQTTVSKDGVETETHDTEIELYDAQSALDKLAKVLRLYNGDEDDDKKDVNIIVTVKGQNDD